MMKVQVSRGLKQAFGAVQSVGSPPEADGSAPVFIPAGKNARFYQRAWGGGSPLRFGLLIGLLGLLVSLVSQGNGYYDWASAVCDGLLGFGTGIAVSWAGLPGFGQGLYFAIGGYFTAVVRNSDIPVLLVLLCGSVLAGLVALLFGLLFSRLIFIAFAMFSLLVSQAGYQILFNVSSLGAENGIYGIGRGSIFGWSLAGNASFWWYCLAILVIVTVLARLFYQSSAGRSIRAVRDDAVKAESAGISARRARVTAFTLAGAICGTSGVIYAQLQGVVDPSMAYWSQSASAVMMVVIGGLGTFYGPVLGGVIYQWLYLKIDNLTTNPDLWLGSIFVLVVLLAPDGLARVPKRIGVAVSRLSKVTGSVHDRA
jgi:branched-chain amino acid transport system permease protein